MDPPLRLRATLNGEAFDMTASALLLRRSDGADTLYIGGWSNDGLAVSVTIAYTGPGTYALCPASAGLVTLLGGDVQTGGYRGLSPRAGDLVITHDEGPGGIMQAQFYFDAQSSSRYQRFGPTVALRSGILRARLEVIPG